MMCLVLHFDMYSLYYITKVFLFLPKKFRKIPFWGHHFQVIYYSTFFLEHLEVIKAFKFLINFMLISKAATTGVL